MFWVLVWKWVADSFCRTSLEIDRIGSPGSGYWRVTLGLGYALGLDISTRLGLSVEHVAIGLGRVDPCGGGQCGRFRGHALEAQRMGDERSRERDGALCGECHGAAIMDGGRRHQADSPVSVFVVIPLEELLAVRPCILDRTKAVGEVGPILQGFELRLRVRIVV